MRFWGRGLLQHINVTLLIGEEAGSKNACREVQKPGCSFKTRIQAFHANHKSPPRAPLSWRREERGSTRRAGAKGLAERTLVRTDVEKSPKPRRAALLSRLVATKMPAEPFEALGWGHPPPAPVLPCPGKAMPPPGENPGGSFFFFAIDTERRGCQAASLIKSQSIP